MVTSWQVENFIILAYGLEGASLRQIRPWWTSSPSLFFAVLCWLWKGPILPEIVKLTKLQILWLNANKLTGRKIHNFIQWTRMPIITSNKTRVNQFTISLFRWFVLTLCRANSDRNRQIDEFEGAWFAFEPAHRSVNAQFYSIILKAYLNDLESVSQRQIRPWWTSSPARFWCCFCLGFVWCYRCGGGQSAAGKASPRMRHRA